MDSEKSNNLHKTLDHPKKIIENQEKITKKPNTKKDFTMDENTLVENDINLILKDTQIIQMVKDLNGEMSVHIKCNLGNKPYLRFIIDTGSQCSFILGSALKPDTIIYTQFKKTISGISGNTLESKGTVFVTMNIANKLLMHEFQVMPEGLLEAEGLWGADLLNQMDILSTSNRIIVKKLHNEKIEKRKAAVEKLNEAFTKQIDNPGDTNKFSKILMINSVEPNSENQTDVLINHKKTLEITEQTASPEKFSWVRFFNKSSSESSSSEISSPERLDDFITQKSDNPETVTRIKIMEIEAKRKNFN